MKPITLKALRHGYCPFGSAGRWIRVEPQEDGYKVEVHSAESMGEFCN